MSVASKASNVLLAKCRAKFGRRLTHSDIEALCSCRSVQETAAYLKANTRYCTVLETADPNAMNRLSLENAVRRMMYDEFSALCRYELSVGDWFSDYILMNGEIRQIMSYLWLLSAGHPEDFILSLPGFFLQHADFDIARLASCRNYGEFLVVMRPSRFGRILRTFTPLDGEPLDCAVIEHALYNLMYKTIFDIIEKHYSGSAREELLDILNAQLELRNFSSIYRMKKYYAADNDSIRAMLLGSPDSHESRLLRRLISAGSSDEALRIFLERSRLGRKMGNVSECAGVEFAAHEIMLSKAAHMLRFSIHPSSVLLAYIIFAETEVQDIITISEAVHYGMPPEEIMKIIAIDSLK